MTFRVFQKTRSALATGMITDLYTVLTASLAIGFGRLVDPHCNTQVMPGSSVAAGQAPTPTPPFSANAHRSLMPLTRRPVSV